MGKGREWLEVGRGPVLGVEQDVTGAGFWSSVSSVFSTALSWTSDAASTVMVVADKALDKASSALDTVKDLSKTAVATGQSVVDFVSLAVGLIPGGSAVLAGSNQVLNYRRTGNAVVEKLEGAGLGDGSSFRQGAGTQGSMALLADGSLSVSASGDAFDFVPVQGGGAWVMLRLGGTLTCTTRRARWRPRASWAQSRACLSGRHRAARWCCDCCSARCTWGTMATLGGA